MSISEYKELYNSTIIAKSNAIIIEYLSHNRNLKYRPFSHNSNKSCLDDLYELIIDNTVFYAFSEDEILSMNRNMAILDDLRSAAKFAFSDRLPKRTYANSDGTLGEILLDLLIQAYEPDSEKLIARAKHTGMCSKTEITGYDALYFTKDIEGITLWLGQAKAGQAKYCKTDIKNDLNTKFSSSYFSNTAFYIATRCSSPSLLSIVNQINKLCFIAQKDNYTSEKKAYELFALLLKNNIKIKIPCLLAFSSDIYLDSSLLENEVLKCTEAMCTALDSEKYSIDLPLPFEILFYIFPIKDISYIRERIVELKKEVV